MAETDKVTDLEFKWGKKRGVGRKKKELCFYESFTYDGVEYSLYDCVYMHKEGEPEPYIGKLIQVYENANKTKKVKVQWFFRSSEILRWLGDEMTLENEIFLASGEGLGLANVNSLESIAGKCNVVCISKDSRNYQPTEEELKMADYVFYRTFDVGLCTISDKMDDKVGGLEIKFIFNRTEGENASGIPKLVFDGKEENKNAIACDGNEQLSIQCTPDELVSLKTRGDYNQALAANDVKDSLLKCESLPEVKRASGSGVNSNAFATTSVQQASALCQRVTTCKVDAVKDEVRKSIDNKVKAEERQKSAKDSDILEDRPTKKARTDNSIKSPVDKSINSSQKLVVQGNDMKAMLTTAATSEEKTESRHDKDPLRQVKGVKSARELDDLENRPSKKAKVDSSVEDKRRKNIQKVRVNSDGNHAKDLVTSGNSYEGRTKSRIAMDSFGQKSISKKEKLEENERKNSNGKLPEASASDSAYETTVDKSINSSQKLVVQDNDMKGMLTTAAAASEEKTESDLENRPSKKAKVDSSVEEKRRNNIQKVSVNSDGNHEKDLVTSGNSYEGRTKSIIAMDSFGQKSPKKEKLEENTRKNSNGKLPKASASDSAYEDRETDGKVFEVTQRSDADKSKWFRTLPFEERLQNEHVKGTLVLLQNLDLEYTSGEVQDIIQHAFDESCTAKMVQRTSISSPHSGQAIVIFKTREATEKVIKRLSEECLMLPNGRPLVGSTGPPLNFPGKQSTHYGHLVIDNKLQSQREMKDAVSTSHCSQPNTIEYDMAMEWCLLQSRSDSWWKMLYKQQGQELRKLKANLKSK